MNGRVRAGQALSRKAALQFLVSSTVKTSAFKIATSAVAVADSLPRLLLATGANGCGRPKHSHNFADVAIASGPAKVGRFSLGRMGVLLSSCCSASLASSASTSRRRLPASRRPRRLPSWPRLPDETLRRDAPGITTPSESTLRVLSTTPLLPPPRAASLTAR